MIRVKSADLVRAQLADPNEPFAEAAPAPANPNGPACLIAQDNYRREWFYLNLWNLLWLVLGAATVVLFLLACWLLGTAALQTDSQVGDRIGKAVTGLGSALGTLVTGKGTLFVIEQRKTQFDAVQDGLTTVGQFCGMDKQTQLDNAAKDETFKLA